MIQLSHFLGIFPRQMKVCIYTKTMTWMFIAALFATAKTGSSKRLDKQIHRVEDYCCSSRPETLRNRICVKFAGSIHKGWSLLSGEARFLGTGAGPLSRCPCSAGTLPPEDLNLHTNVVGLGTSPGSCEVRTPLAASIPVRRDHFK